MARTADPHMRTRILDAADRLLARDGFRRMTVDGVAREAGVGKGSVYLHFESKEDVALSCIDRMAAGVVAELERLAAGPGGAATRLREMLGARVLLRFDYARRHAPSIDEKLAVMRQAMLERRAGHFDDEVTVLARVIGEGRRDGTLGGPLGAEAAARALVTATNALLPYSLSVRELGRRAELARRVDDVLTLLLDGLRPDASARRKSPTRSRRSS
ncbi:MAG: TetR/AcrR family transcriptional regulator [Candidatus Eisenbacteria bacterium]|uniref:TetR/AcrR family transcriptional regulator n=1 Tax=Eiseniibacteriota bacterium TaxID=2212470 RepID=A0A933WB59_UNCEI|nr:TetR/AcrR family transcriptional regulator [Candidatus Eisenbacteria bacterium]